MNTYDPQETVRFDVNLTTSCYGMLAEDYCLNFLPFIKKFNLKVVRENNPWGSSDVTSVTLEGTRKDFGDFFKADRRKNVHQLIAEGLYFGNFETETVAIRFKMTERMMPRRIETDLEMEKILKENQEIADKAKAYNIKTASTTYTRVEVGGQHIARQMFGEELFPKKEPKFVWFRTSGGNTDSWTLTGTVANLKRFLTEGLGRSNEEVAAIPTLNV